MNITLIGMPGSGKSYIGKYLAHELGYTLIDLDACIEKKYGSPLQSILDTLGDTAFLDMEAHVAITETQGKDSLVVSPGGSLVYTVSAMEHLKKISHIIYLETPLKIVKQRITQNTRGIVGLKSKTLDALYEERTDLYRKWATYTVDSSGDGAFIVKEIIAHLKGK